MRRKTSFFFIFFLLSLVLLSIFFISLKYLNISKTKKTIILVENFKIVKISKISDESGYSYFDSFYNFFKNYKIYIIKFGDTLWKIKQKFKLKEYSKIIRLNNIKNPDLIYSGNILKIPEK